jgi:hypothetical protein
MINVTFSAQCIHLMRELGISGEVVTAVINNRHQGLLSSTLDRMIATHWFEDNHIVLVTGHVTKTTINNTLRQVIFNSIEADLVLLLNSELPAAQINRSMNAADLFALVAQSFGCPVTCHLDQRPTHLYSGRWNGQDVQVFDLDDGPILITGTFSPLTETCEFVWAFNLKKYRTWLNTVTMPLRKVPVRAASRVALDPLIENAKAYAQDLLNSNSNIRATPERIQYELALHILRSSLGDEWCRRNLFDQQAHSTEFTQLGKEGIEAMKSQLEWL